MKLLNKKKHLYNLIIILILFFISLYPQDFNSFIIGSSSDHHLLTLKYIVQFYSNFNYPFIYNMGNSLDLFASSIHSALHPLYFLINIFLTDKALLKETFVKLHMLLFIFGLFFYLNNKINNKIILSTLIISISNSISYVANVSHPFFICVYSYFPIIMILIDKIIETQKKIYLFIFFITLSLMILIGHFQHQFIFLTFLMLYMFFKIIKKKLLLKTFFNISFCILLAFIIALPQLLPVFDLMISGDRSSVGSISRFDQSFNAFGIISYFLPGINLIFYKHFNEYYRLFTTAPSIVEGMHYLGIVTITLFFFFLNKIKSEIKNNEFIIPIIFLLLRALGIFFIINLFLNYLPLFGQFRAPVRNLYLIDFLIIVFIAINFKKNFLLSEYKAFLTKFLKHYVFFISILLFFILIFEYNSLYKIEYIDYLVLFFSFIILILLTIFLKYIKNLNSIFIIILLLSIVDIGFYKFITPLHSKIEDYTKVKENIKHYENFCSENNTKSIITTFDHEKIKNDLPRFRYGEKENSHYLLSKNDNKNKISEVDNYIYAYECNISMGVKFFTLGTYGATELHNLLYFETENFTPTLKDKIYILSLLGFTHFLDFENNKLEIYNKNFISDYDKSIINTLIVNKFFLKNKKRFEIFSYEINLFFYNKIKKTNFKNLLSTFYAEVNNIDNFNVIGFGGDKNIIIEDLNNNLVKFENKDPFIIVKTNEKTLKVTHVPTPFLIGIILIFPLMLITAAFYILFAFIFQKIIKINTNKLYFGISKINLIITKLDLTKQSRIISWNMVFIILVCFFYLYFLGTEKININGSKQYTIKYSLLFIFYFFISILFLIKIINIDNSLKLKKFYLYFILANIIVGTVLMGELIVYNTPEILIEKFNLDINYFDSVKIFLSRYFW